MGILKRIGEQVVDKAISLITVPAEYEPAISNEGDDMATKRGKKFVRFDTASGEVKIRVKSPEPPPAPAPMPMAAPIDRYVPPRISRGNFPRITPKRPRLRR